MKSKILVTGGAGLIGTNLCYRLINDGESVICLDNFISGSTMNVRALLNNPNFELLKWDVINPIKLSDLKAIYHLACPASPKQYQKNPVHTIETCVQGTLNMLELAKSEKCPILFSSTSEVYGDPLVHPQPEEYFGNVNPIGPRSCYDEGKRATETLCLSYKQMFDVDVKIVRIFNTYGPYLNPADGRVVSNFILQALHGDSLTVYGDGTQTRSFCFVKDTVNGLIKMMDSSETGPINIGNPNEITINELASIIGELVNVKVSVKNQELPQNDPIKRKPDITKAKTLLNWSAETSLKDGLLQTINYFKTYEHIN